MHATASHRAHHSPLDDIKRDWRRWSRAERIAAPVILGGLIAATVPILWLIAR